MKIIDFVRHQREMMALEVLSSPRHEIFLQFYLAELPPVISWIGLRAARGGIGALCSVLLDSLVKLFDPGSTLV